MNAVAGERDTLIMNTVPRYRVSIAEKALLLATDTPVFAVNGAGVATPAAITLTAQLVNIAGTVAFTVSAGAALAIDGQVATLRFVDMTVDVAFVQARVTDAESGVEFVRSAVISKVFAGAAGATYYTWVKYGDDAQGSGLSDNPAGKTYIGLAYNQTTPVESGVPGDYAWSLIKGADGVPGVKGTDGQTLYTWIKYADQADGTGLYDAPNDATLYIGLATNRPSAVKSSVKTDYVWSKFRGDQGVPGAPGAAAPTLYTWVKYADTATGAGLSDDPAGKAWIGLAYNKPTPVESISAGDYAWSLLRGADGVPGSDGANGLPGVKGNDGQTLYTWIKYADNPEGAGMYDTPNANTLYLGLSTNRASQAEGSNPADYVWSKFRGDQGVPGTAAPALYTWVKYADSSAGAGLTDDPSGKAWIGLAYNRTTAAEGVNPADYSWSLVKGADGLPGPKGADGQSLYSWVKYADFADGTGLYDFPGPTTLYIGLSVNRPVQSESGNKEDYVWSRFRGDQGVPGTTGPQGQRGTKTVVAGGYSAWTDASAAAELAAAGFGAPINRDVVTLYGPVNSAPTFTMTKFYDNGSWVVLGTHIDGGLLVDGTVGARALSVDRLSALSANLGNVTAGDMYGVSVRGGAFVDGHWPLPQAGGGFYLGAEALRLGSYPGGRFFEVTAAGDVTAPGLVISQGNLTLTGNITGSTFTGGRVQTSVSGQRVVLDSTNNQLRAYGSGGALLASLGESPFGGGTLDITASADVAIRTQGTCVFNGGVNQALALFSSSVIGLDMPLNTRAGNIFPGGASFNLGGSNSIYSAWRNIYSQTALTIISDARDKDDIKDSDLGLDFILSLRPVSYRMKIANTLVSQGDEISGPYRPTEPVGYEEIRTPVSGVRNHYGFIAQEVKKSLGDRNAGIWVQHDPADADSQQLLRYEELLAPTVKAVQELHSIAKNLVAEVSELKLRLKEKP